MTNVHRCVTTLDVGRRPSSAGEEWQSFKILIHGFADLPSAVGEYTLSPEFKCNGHKWCIKLYHGGESEASVGHISLYLQHCSGGTATTAYEMSFLDKYQNVNTKIATDCSFDSDKKNWGWPKFVSRSYILDQSNNILDDKGTLAVVVSIKRDDASPFVPSNPTNSMIMGMFLDEETADVCFEVNAGVNVDDGDELPVPFHAHSQILQGCAPMLASLFGSDEEKIATASITDVKPAIFRHLLHYVYGGSVAEGELNTNAKDIINAADKYSIVNLKLEAEAAYVKSTKITMDNAMDNLLYADSINLALLKEVVVDFLVENHDEAIESLSFDDFPVNLMKDLLVAVVRKVKDGKHSSKDNYTTMRVSELRMQLTKERLDVDGSREAMIEALKNFAEASENEGGESD